MPQYSAEYASNKHPNGQTLRFEAPDDTTAQRMALSKQTNWRTLSVITREDGTVIHDIIRDMENTTQKRNDKMPIRAPSPVVKMSQMVPQGPSIQIVDFVNYMPDLDMYDLYEKIVQGKNANVIFLDNLDTADGQAIVWYTGNGTEEQIAAALEAELAQPDPGVK